MVKASMAAFDGPYGMCTSERMVWKLVVTLMIEPRPTGISGATRRLQAPGVAVEQRHPRPRPKKCLRGRQANPPSGPGHDCDLAVEHMIRSTPVAGHGHTPKLTKSSCRVHTVAGRLTACKPSRPWL